MLCCMVGVGAFLVPPPPLTPTAGPKPLRALSRTALGAVKTQEDPELTVFDASDVAVSWADYKKQKPNEYKVCASFLCLFEAAGVTVEEANRASVVRPLSCGSSPRLPTAGATLDPCSRAVL